MVQTPEWVLLVWDKRIFEKVDVVGKFSVSVLLKGVVDGFYGLVQGFMALMMIDYGFFMGRVGMFACQVEHGMVFNK